MHVTPSLSTNPTHAWLKQIGVAFVPGPMTPLLETFRQGLLERFAALGHQVSDPPAADIDVLFTTAAFGQPVSWREALFFTARRALGLKHSPVVYNIIPLSSAEFEDWMARLAADLAKDPPQAEDFQFDGLSETAYKVLIEQGSRGGPILSLARMLQAQAKSIRILLLVGDDKPERVYHFDLVGAYPASHYTTPEAFYSDIVLRIVTTESTTAVTNHELIEPSIEFSEWEGLSTPEAMRRAGNEIGARGFFTDMVRIEDLVQVPAVNEGVAKQYSEGCFATWDPRLGALIATVTGSARPVHKGRLTDDDLAVIVGVRADGSGAQVRHVDGKRNDPPSSEAVEMMDMDEHLPQVPRESVAGVRTQVPVIRSKLHGHRGVKAFNPALVEYVPLDPPYYHYLVSCATEAQARGIKAAFSRAVSLLNPDDPRKIAFTVLPGHGVVMAEKWQPGKAPFELLWEAMDSGDLEIDAHVPQGVMDYLPGEDGRHHLHEA